MRLFVFGDATFYPHKQASVTFPKAEQSARSALRHALVHDIEQLRPHEQLLEILESVALDEVRQLIWKLLRSNIPSRGQIRPAIGTFVPIMDPAKQADQGGALQPSQLKLPLEIRA